jgi:hypothetical protein
VWFGTAYFGPSDGDLEEPPVEPVVVTRRRSRRVGWFERFEQPLPRIIIDGNIRERVGDVCSGTIQVVRDIPVAVDPDKAAPVPPLVFRKRPPAMCLSGTVREKGEDTLQGKGTIDIDLRGDARERLVDKCEGSGRLSWETEDETLVREFIAALNASPGEVEITR